MDFKSLISLADKQHCNSGGPVKRYSTDIPAPKKPPKGNVQSAAVHAFLAKKRKEEEVRALEFVKKKQDLLELRSMAKHNRKATAMAKRTKDNNFMATFSLADQQQAERMNGDRHLQEPQLPSRSSMKDYGHFGGQIKNGSSRESYGGGSNFSNGPQQHKSGTSTGYSQTGPVKKSRPPSENALKFHDLLQLAAKKQHDPIVVQKPQTKSVKDADVQGRLMTSEEKRRFVEEQVRKQGRSLDNVELPPRRQKRRKFREDEMDARDGSVVASVLPTKNVQNSPQSRELNERVRNGAAPTATEGMKNKMLPKIPKLGASIPDKPSKHLSDYPSSVKRLKTSTSSSQNVRTVSQTEQKRPQSIHSQREGHVKMKSSLNGPRVSSATVKSKPSSDISRENYPRPDRVDINGNHKMMLAKAKHIQPTKNGLASSRSVTEPPQRSHLPKDVNSRSPSSRPVQASRPSQNPPPPRKEVQRPVDMSSKCQNPPLKQRPQYDNVQRNMQSSSHLAPKKVASQDLVAKQKSLPDLNRKDLGVKQKALAPDISAKQRALQDFGDRHRQSQNLSERKQSLQDQSIRQKPLQNPIERRREQIDLSVTQKAVVANVGAARQMSSVVNQMPKQFPPPDMMPRQFPPPDMMPRQFPPKDVRRPPIRPMKRRIESDEEYDEEMNDFIDDGGTDDFDYSTHIREIFGYDKSKYLYEVEDEECMESSFVRQMQEEAISTRMGILEDLEDIQRENAQLKAKLRKKKKK